MQTIFQSRRQNNPQGFYRAILWTLGMLTPAAMMFVVNGRYSVAGMPLFWGWLTHGEKLASWAMPLTTLGGWVLVVLCSVFEITMIIRKLRGQSTSLVLSTMVGILSIIDIVTTVAGAYAEFLPASPLGWAVFVVGVTVVTFGAEFLLSLPWKDL